MIEVSGVTKNFGPLKAVDSATFRIEAGEAAALLGINGAGKSTLIKCVLGLLKYEGSISVNDMDISKESIKTKSEIGYVPQKPVFYDMRTSELIRFFASIRGVSKERAGEVLSITGLEEHASKYTSELSGGMRQRLSFAIALLSSPPILILDEPTSNLDAKARGDFLNLVLEYKNEGTTLLFSSHRLDEVKFLSDRVLFMKSGRILLDAKPGNLEHSLGLKIKMNLTIPGEYYEKAISTLNEAGINHITGNGSEVSLEVESGKRAIPIKALLEKNINVSDFRVIEPSMEHIINRIDADV